MYPQLLLWIIGALACFLPFEHILLAKKGKNIDKDRSEPVHPLTKITIAFLIMVVLAAPYLKDATNNDHYLFSDAAALGLQEVSYNFTLCRNIPRRCVSRFLKSPKCLFRFRDFWHHFIKIKRFNSDGRNH